MKTLACAFRLRIRVFSLLLAVLLLLAVPSALAVPSEPEYQYNELTWIDYYIQNYYLYADDAPSRLPEGLGPEDFAEDQLKFYEVLETLTRDFDNYSRFMTLEEYYELYPQSSYETGGIGVTVDGSMDKGVFVAAVLPGGAAEDAGILVNDQICAVDGVDTRGKNYAEVTSLLRGIEGTTVKVAVRRPGETENRLFELVRRTIKIRYTNGEVLDGTTGYIRIDSFVAGDELLFQECLDEFGAAGLSRLIIDLRGNTGGDVNAMAEMLCRLGGTEGETLFTLVSKSEREEYVYTDRGGWKPERLAVLVNEMSASASEMFAGSLQDRGLAQVAGTSTYGKARAQSVIPIGDDVLILTTFTVELPVSGEYQGTGILPGHEVAQEVVWGADTSQLPEMPSESAIFPKLCQSGRVLALEERLAFLGWFRAEPDNVFDGYTLHVLHCFQAAAGLTETSYAGVRTLKMLEAQILIAGAAAYIPVDTQLEFAKELLR